MTGNFGKFRCTGSIVLFSEQKAFAFCTKTYIFQEEFWNVVQLYPNDFFFRL